MFCGWDNNRGSDIALIMHHRLRWFIHLVAQGLKKGNEHPAYTLCGGVAHSTFTLSDTACPSVTATDFKYYVYPTVPVCVC